MQDFKKIKTASEVVGIVCAILIMIAYGISSVFPEMQQLKITNIMLLLIAVIGLMAGLIFLAVWLLEVRREKGAAGNTLIIKRSQKAVRRMLKLTARIDKKMMHEMTDEEKKSSRVRLSKLYTSINSLSNKPVTHHEKEIGFFEHSTPYKLAQAIQRQPIHKIAEINNIIIFSMLKLERPLLSAEQYKARIRFGKYLLNHSCHPYDQEKAYLDFLGWTYSLSGRSKKAKEYIEKGIALLTKHLQKDSVITDYKMTQGLLVRAYRHLGSDQTTMANNPEKSLDYFQSSLLEWDKLHAPINDEMHVGIQYGIAAAEITLFKKYTYKGQMSEKTFSLFQHAYRLIREYGPMAEQYPNKHRYLKFVVLENEALSILMKLFISKNSEAFTLAGTILDDLTSRDSVTIVSEITDRYNRNLSTITNVLDNNIYADEAIASYLEQEVELTIQRVENCIKAGLYR